jgi:hypothetical protein
MVIVTNVTVAKVNNQYIQEAWASSLSNSFLWYVRYEVLLHNLRWVETVESYLVNRKHMHHIHNEINWTIICAACWQTYKCVVYVFTDKEKTLKFIQQWTGLSKGEPRYDNNI